MQKCNIAFVGLHKLQKIDKLQNVNAVFECIFISKSPHMGNMSTLWEERITFFPCHSSFSPTGAFWLESTNTWPPFYMWTFSAKLRPLSLNYKTVQSWWCWRIWSRQTFLSAVPTLSGRVCQCPVSDQNTGRQVFKTHTHTKKRHCSCPLVQYGNDYAAEDFKLPYVNWNWSCKFPADRRQQAIYLKCTHYIALIFSRERITVPLHPSIVYSEPF